MPRTAPRNLLMRLAACGRGESQTRPYVNRPLRPRHVCRVACHFSPRFIPCDNSHPPLSMCCASTGEGRRRRMFLATLGWGLILAPATRALRSVPPARFQMRDAARHFSPRFIPCDNSHPPPSMCCASTGEGAGVACFWRRWGGGCPLRPIHVILMPLNCLGMKSRITSAL